MAQTLAQKIIARAAGRESVRVGELVIASVDLAMMHDSGGPRRVAAMLAEIGATVWNRDKVVVVTDHFVPAVDADSARILKITRDWVKTNGIERFHDMQGICHVVVSENGHIRPGMFAVGGDSHSPTSGAFGTFMFGIGATEMAGVLATGEIWIKVPETQEIRWCGRLRPTLSAKDMMLATLKRLGLNTLRYGVAQYAGSAVEALSMAERMVLTNMSAELGAQTGLIEPDATTWRALRAAGVAVGNADDTAALRGDADAEFAARWEFDADSLVPQVAAPHTPDNVGDAAAFGHVRIDQAYIGACTGAKLEDLQMAASILRNHRVHPQVRLLIAPASTRMTAAAAADGTLEVLTRAGAHLLPSGCGACAGYGGGILAENEVCISTTARNFKGRMGHATSQVYLASPYTVAASAVTGSITDPRTLTGARAAA